MVKSQGEGVSYKADNIAKVLIKKYIDMESPTTHMKLQKMLYYSWIEYYKRTGTYLFKDPIHAWRFGPVIKSVYFDYRIFAGAPITMYKDMDEVIDKDTDKFLSDFAEAHKDYTANGLVFRSHRKGTPWDEVYEEGKKDIIIPFDRIVEIECRT